VCVCIAGLEPVYDSEFTSHLAKDTRVLEVVCVCVCVCMRL